MTTTDARHRIVRVLQSLARWARDGWLIVGVTLLVLVGLEAGYRLQAAVRVAIASPTSTISLDPSRPRHPYTDSSWFRTYGREYDSSFTLQWKPYVYFRRPPFSGSVINVDSAGHRRTIPGPRPAADTIRVFVFGGSTLWGTDLRDAATIPSVLSRVLASKATSDVTFDVTNLGETGYVFTQEMLELELQLRVGHVPNIVVFYDGINDVGAAVQSGQVGLPMNESNRVREFQLGRVIYGTELGPASDARVAAVMVQTAVQRSQLLQRLVGTFGRRATSERRTVVARGQSLEALTRDQVRIYLGNVEMIEALSRAYGFKVVYVWQPTFQTTTKRLTPREQALLRTIEGDEFNRQQQVMHRAIVPLLDSAMSRRVGTRFVDASPLFAGDTISVFTDRIGHTTEKAVPTIVGAFFPQVWTMVDSIRAAKRVITRRVSGGATR
jgi:hypothetical protein